MTISRAMCRTSVFLIVFTIIADLSGAQIRKECIIDSDYHKCLAKDTTYANTCACAFVAFNKWYKDMEKTYDKLSRTIKKESERQALRASQKAWQAYKDAEFNTYNYLFNFQGNKWCTIRQDKRIDMIRARALQLHDYLDSLKKR